MQLPVFSLNSIHEYSSLAKLSHTQKINGLPLLFTSECLYLGQWKRQWFVFVLLSFVGISILEAVETYFCK